MKEPRNSPEHLSADERRLVDTIARTYAPEPRSPMQRARFRHAIEDRLDRSRWSPWSLRPALGAAGIALAIALALGLPVRESREMVPGSLADGQGEFLMTLALDDSELNGLGDMLPEDYAAIAELLDI